MRERESERERKREREHEKERERESTTDRTGTPPLLVQSGADGTGRVAPGSAGPRGPGELEPDRVLDSFTC